MECCNTLPEADTSHINRLYESCQVVSDRALSCEVRQFYALHDGTVVESVVERIHLRTCRS